MKGRTEYHVVRDGKHTVIFGMYDAGDEFIPFAGASGKSPGDKENSERGFNLALGRAFRNLGRTILKEEYDVIYQQYRNQKKTKVEADASPA